VIRLRRFAASAGQVRVLAVAGMLAVLPAVASGQPRRGSIEFAGGVVWTGGYSAGSAPANETRNPSGGSTPLTLFQTDSRVLGAIGLDARAGVYLSRRVLVEGLFELRRPVLRTHLSGDFESAASADADVTIASYLFGASLLYDLRAGRAIPFVSGGAGYVREIPEGGDVLTGTEVHAGGGLTYGLTRGHRPLGARLEVQASERSRSVAFDQKRRILASVAAGLTWRF